MDRRIDPRHRSSPPCSHHDPISEVGITSQQGPLVSIITPCLNPGERIERCLESVRSQSYPDIEHIIVDGGSDDGTVDRLESTSGIAWISEPDSGQSNAINKGFSMARGEVLGWLNADDLFFPETVRRVVERLQQPKVAWVYGDNKIVTGAEEKFTRPPTRLLQRHLARGNPVPQAGVLIKKTALERAGGLDESLNYVMDLDLWIRLMESGQESAYVPHVLAEAEIHEDSKSGAAGGRVRFMHECALVWYQRGWHRSAAIGLGRTAAYLAADAVAREDREVEHRDLEEAVRAVHESFVTESGVGDGDRALPFRQMLAGAVSEAIRVEFGRGPRRYRHLLHLEPWLYPESRHQLVASVARKLTGDRFPRMA